MTNSTENEKQPDLTCHESSPVGSSVYSRTTLKFYDFIVHFLTNRLVWRCATKHLVEHCDIHLSSNHLEIGIGSGKLFKRSAINREFERLAIADANPNCLQVSAQNLNLLKPETWKINLINPNEELGKMGRFQSIGMNYVLHCLPLAMHEKLQVCDRLIDHSLQPQGVLFGTTLFPQQNSHWLSRKLMSFYNRKKIFTNLEDSSKAFKQWCEDRGRDYNFFAVGCVGFFSIRRSNET